MSKTLPKLEDIVICDRWLVKKQGYSECNMFSIKNNTKDFTSMHNHNQKENHQSLKDFTAQRSLQVTAIKAVPVKYEIRIKIEWL